MYEDEHLESDYEDRFLISDDFLIESEYDIEHIWNEEDELNSTYI